jgi:hypothetical protein
MTRIYNALVNALNAYLFVCYCKMTLISYDPPLVIAIKYLTGEADFDG